MRPEVTFSCGSVLAGGVEVIISTLVLIVVDGAVPLQQRFFLPKTHNDPGFKKHALKKMICRLRFLMKNPCYTPSPERDVLSTYSPSPQEPWQTGDVPIQ